MSGSHVGGSRIVFLARCLATALAACAWSVCESFGQRVPMEARSAGPIWSDVDGDGLADRVDSCPYQPYDGVGFFTSARPGELVYEVEHGGSRPGYASAFVVRPEADLAVSILANADVSPRELSYLAKTILDDFER